MLPNLSGLSLLHHATVDTEADEAKRKRTASPVPPPLKLLLEELPEDVLVRVLGYVKGMSCKEVALVCNTSKEFNRVCQNDDFWKWQSKLRGYDRSSRIEWFKHKYKSTTGHAISTEKNVGFWKACYTWWCNHTLTNYTIAPAVYTVVSAASNILGLDRNDIHQARVARFEHFKYGPIADWDVSGVTDMSGLFSYATEFNGDLSKWDVSNVQNMQSMFNGATEFNGDLSKWDVSSVNNMRQMFEFAKSFNGNLSNWNVSNVVNMSDMFSGATEFNGDVSRWFKKGTSVTSMDGMFKNATSFNHDVSEWDVSNVKNMKNMFEGTTLPDARRPHTLRDATGSV